MLLKLNDNLGFYYYDLVSLETPKKIRSPFVVTLGSLISYKGALNILFCLLRCLPNLSHQIKNIFQPPSISNND